MKKARKVRLKPTPEQEKLLWQSAGTARWAYNLTLKLQETNKRLGGSFLSNNDIRKHITKMKKRPHYKWLFDVSNNIPKQAVKDACGAYVTWFDSMKGKNKTKAEKPRLKSRKRSKPSFYNDYVKFKVKGKSVLIEKVGWVLISEALPENKTFSNPRISFDGKYWYVSVGFEHRSDVCSDELPGEVLGIDLGVKHLAVVSDGRKYGNVNKKLVVKKIEKRLRRLQRQVSRKYEMNRQGKRFVKTQNIKKLEMMIRKVHRKLRCIRDNHIHQTTRRIVKTKPSKVVMEDLNVKGMLKNKHLAKSIAQQKFYEFIRVMKYKCEFLGIEFVQADRFYPSSKRCSCCGVVKKQLKLSDRTFKCDDCGFEKDRDENASLNLAAYGN